MAELLREKKHQPYPLQNDDNCFDITHDKMYAIEFKEQPTFEVQSTSKVYAYSFMTERCYQLKYQDIDEKGNPISAWGGLTGLV